MIRADFPAGRAQGRLAEALDRRWTRVAAGMADGLVSPAQATVVVEVLDDLPDHLDPELRAQAETEMVNLCGQFRPSELRRLGRHLLELVAPEIAEAEEAKRLENEEQRAREKTSLRSRLIGDGLARTTIVHPVLDRDRLLTYLESYTSPRKHQDAISGEEDRIPHHRLLGQAFGALLEHLDPAKLPAHGGDATTVMVTISLESLQSELGTGSIVGGEPLSATAIRRLACTAGIIPVVLGGKGEILDLGRTRRLFSPAQRKAMRLRDQRCRAEGCTIPAAWCEAHHLKPWSEGGNTDLDDGILACNCHHHRLHDPRYPTRPCPTATSASTAADKPKNRPPKRIARRCATDAHRAMGGKPGSSKVGCQVGDVVRDHDRRCTLEPVPDARQVRHGTGSGATIASRGVEGIPDQAPDGKAWVMTTSMRSRPSVAGPARRSIAREPSAAPRAASASETSARATERCPPGVGQPPTTGNVRY